jgi:dihydrofolate reductase
MSLVRVHNFSVSLDGFGTGEGQSLEAPFGHAGHRHMEWFFGTRTFRAMQGQSDGSMGVDDAYASMWDQGIGAEIMGRNKFAASRGPWSGVGTDDEWRGWWGDNPPFHTPVFVLTHHPRPPIEMDGGTTFHFIDASPAQALAAAREAAGGGDVRIGGGWRRFATSLPRTSSTTCTSSSPPSCSAVASGCGMAWKTSTRASALRRCRRRAA